ncbi:MAG TPA: Zn-ribbon domain-containing OB-fold protein [Candidatus Altiarchaeales archaeon]|nr:Zn-ribbon domain-containing OB-fold protein [Candidatus Altiarchaeales archaeon]
MSKGLPLHWRLIPQRYNLIGTECLRCGEKFFPPRQLCPNCRRAGKIREVKFSGEGEIYSYTIIHTPPEGFEFMRPYAMGIIKLIEGPLVTAQLVDCKPEDLEIGKRVESVFRKVIADGSSGIIRYGYKFRLKD